MKRRGIAAAMMLCTGLLMAGKNVAPAQAPVVPVATPWPLYVGMGLVMTNIDRDPCPCEDGSTIIEDHRYGGILRVGFDFNPYLGIEARLLKTFGDNVFSETTHYGLYLKPQYALSERLNIYGLLGYGNTTIDYKNGVRSSTTDENGVAYGIGAEYVLSQNEDGSSWSLWADYSRLLKDGGAKHSTVDLAAGGIKYNF